MADQNEINERFSQWWHGSKYTQVVISSDAMRQCAKDAWDAALAAAPQPAAQPAHKDAEDDDLLDIARTICAVAAHMRTKTAKEMEHMPSPIAEFSPLLMAARDACLKRGYTADGLAIQGMDKGAEPKEPTA